ncbi:hypothetical protein OKA04_14000 [Luteolibacter flavescens]|uniref:SGNH/GDSL hydrolase family protein n=1 Tax=Luteolibacter flavescens TaxID=1859460 RepID=A0ABT3FQI8_9BACT|nr:hypothetical protein [Luteolibacter flavescens]MCW1885848.1 hypothetical protein [Luteolibacter flavescens]
MRLPRKSFLKFTLSVLISAAVILAVFIGINTWVNPLWVSKAPWSDDSFAEYRPIYRYQRTGKAGIAEAQPWKVAFFGSSRIDIAFDPALPQWNGTPAVNLAVSAGTLPETAPILHYTLERAPLEMAIVGIDIGDLLGGNSPIKSTGFMESPFNPDGNHLEQSLRYYAGISSFESAVQTIINKSKNRLPEYTPLGHRLRHQETVDVAKVIQRDAISHALRVTRRRKANPPAEPNETKAEKLRQILKETKEHNCRLVLVIPPSHATYLGVFYHQGDPDPTFSKDRIAIARMVAESNAQFPAAPPAIIWDFNDFHPFNAEKVPMDASKMHWWLDGTHARKALGDVMLARIMGWPVEPAGADFGFQLTEANAAERDKALRDGYERFKTEQSDLWNWMEQGILKYQDTAAKSSAKDEAAPEF